MTAQPSLESQPLPRAAKGGVTLQSQPVQPGSVYDFDDVIPF
ncbi:single-strand DNA binding protein [Escherichia coli E22]|nr:single-strand DNA binding protein [Escherichia coli E22]